MKLTNLQVKEVQNHKYGVDYPHSATFTIDVDNEPKKFTFEIHWSHFEIMGYNIYALEAPLTKDALFEFLDDSYELLYEATMNASN